MKTAVVNALSADPVRQVYITLLNQTSQRGEQAVTHDTEEGLESHIPEILHLFHEAHLLCVCVCMCVRVRVWHLQQVSMERPAQQKLYQCDSSTHLHFLS